MIASAQMILVIIVTAACACLAARRAVRRGSDVAWLAVLTPVIGLPLWITCDATLLRVLPDVWWFDPREPLAPYVLLYLPLSMALAVVPASALLVGARRCVALLRRDRLAAAGR